VVALVKKQRSNTLSRQQGVDYLKVLLRVRDLLTTLLGSSTTLLLLLELLAGQLAGRLDLLDVTEGIDLDLLLLHDNLLQVLLSVVVAGDNELTSIDRPLLNSDSVSELAVVGNNDHSTTKVLDGQGQSSERVTIQVVGGLVQDQQMGVEPHGGGKDDLDLLTTGKTANTAVGGELGIKSEITQVLLDLNSGQGAGPGTSLGSLLVVKGLKDLLETPLLELLTGNPGVVLIGAANELNLVLERALGLATSIEILDLDLLDLLVDLPLDELLHLGLLLGRDLASGLVDHLAILTVLVTPADVLVGGLVQVLLDVVEGVLGDVGDTNVGVLGDNTVGGDGLTGQDLDEGRLSGTVGSDDGNTRVEGDLARHVHDGQLGGAGVGKVNVLELDKGLILGLDTVQETGLGELEGDGRGRQLVVGLALGVLLNELGQVTLVLLELAGLVVDNTRADSVEESRVVGNDHGGDVGQGVKVVLQPGDVGNIQMVGGLVQKQDIGVHQHGTGQLELHLPTTGKGTDGLLLLLLVESNGLEHLNDGLLVEVLELLVVEDEGQDGEVSILSLEVVLDEDGTELIGRGEALELTIGNGAHEGRLSDTVGSAKTVTLTTTEVEAGLVQQNHTTVSEGELAVAEKLTLLNILNSGVGESVLGIVVNKVGVDLLSKGGNLGIGTDDSEVGGNGSDPGILLEVAGSDQLGAEGGDVGENGRGESVLLDESGLGLEDLEDLRGRDGVGNNDDLVLGTGLTTTDTDQSGTGTLGNTTELGRSTDLDHAVQTGQELRQELLGVSGVLDELAHVVDNDGGLTLDGGGALSKTTDQQGAHDGESGLLDSGDEGGGSKLVNAVGSLLGTVDASDQVGDGGHQIGVTDNVEAVSDGLGGLVTDLRLGIPHGLADNGDDIRESSRDLLRSRLGQTRQDVHSTDLGLPLGFLDGVEDDGQQETDSVSGGESHDSLGGNLGGLTDDDHLVRVELKDLGHLGDQEGLAGLAKGVGQGGESKESALTVGDGLLVLEEGREALDDGDRLDETLGLGEGGKRVGGDLALLGVLGLDDGINKWGRHIEDRGCVYRGKGGEWWQMSGMGRMRVDGVDAEVMPIPGIGCR